MRLGFVDVPGHERFVRNMLAGIGGIDLVLLVIAADESVKPQTREHFDICRLLSVQRGITVLTKSDLVDAETLEVVRMEVAEYLTGSFLDPASAPIVAVSSKTGDGLDELKRELARLAAEVPAKDASAALRLPIDRVFTMKGFGTVITGTLISGSVRKDDELEVHPGGQAAAGARRAGPRRCRRESDRRTAHRAQSRWRRGQRTGARHDADSRGIVSPDKAGERRAESAAVGQAAARPRAGASACLHRRDDCRGQAAGRQAAQARTVGLARLKLDAPLLLLPGDRFIVRQFSPVITIGGGVVLDASNRRDA